MSHDLIARNADWFRETGQMPDAELPNRRQMAFYTGMQCEELAEKLACILSESHPLALELQRMGAAFKAGELDKYVEIAMLSPNHVAEMLDGDIDLIFVSVGAAKAQGAKVAEAYGAVVVANEAKRFPDGTYHRAPVTGKVLKPEGWQAPNLLPFMHEQFKPRDNSNDVYVIGGNS